VPIFKLGLLISVALMLGACMSQPKPSDPVQPREFRLSDVAKSDVDMAAEVAVKQWRSYLREIAEKLYLRNPNQLRRSDQPTLTAQQAAARLIKADGDLPQIKTTKSSDKVALAFDPLFTGDRVAAFVGGLYGMYKTTYGNDGEFFMHHEFDPQKLYYLARNTEIADWQLRNKRDETGRLFLISHGDAKVGVNLTFSRLFGKLIGMNDLFAEVVADTTNRTIKNVIQGFASAVFFPI